MNTPAHPNRRRSQEVKRHFRTLEVQAGTAGIAQRYRKRSKDQNRFYWGSLVTPLAAHFQCDKQRMHELLKHLFLTGHKQLSTVNGALQLPYVRSTKSLDAGEFEAYCTRIRAWALDQL